VPAKPRPRNSSVCTFCRAPAPSAHCLILTKQWDGTWKAMYRLCWDCGYAELQWARKQSYPCSTLSQYAWVDAQP
jgi:hypothetical protein